LKQVADSRLATTNRRRDFGKSGNDTEERMVKPGIRNCHVLILACMTAVLVACSVASTPPAPDTAAGVYIDTGFEYYRWEEGLALMIWHDAVKSSYCGSHSATESPLFVLECSAISRADHGVDWHLETDDGATADFSIDDRPFDLEAGSVFIITTSTGEVEVVQLQRELSGVEPYSDSVTEFGLADPDIQAFIERQ
jgi:hypothetical protein